MSGAAAAALWSHCVWAQQVPEDSGRKHFLPLISDLVVTATRQATPLSVTPLTVTALSGAALREAGITNPTALGERVPNLSIDRANELQVTIRGITSTNYSEAGDPSVAFMLDGIYLARPQEADASFFDVDRIEVLRGPQGTRFGKNTTAGVIDVIANKPQYDRFEIGANASYGNYASRSLDGFVNLPLGDATALRLATLVDSKDSTTHNAYGDSFNLNPFRRDIALRGTLRQLLGDRGEMLVRASWSKLGGTLGSNAPTSHFFRETADHTPMLDAQGNAIWAPVSSNVDTLLTRDLTSLPIPTGHYGFGASGHTTPWANDGGWGIDGQIDYRIGAVKVAYLGSFRRYMVHENSEIDLYPYASGFPIPGLGAPNPGCPAMDFCSFPAANDGRYRQTNQEIRLSRAVDGRLQPVVGIYYFREESQTSLYIVNSPQFIIGYPNTLYGFPDHTVSASFAPYGEVAYRLAGHVRLSAGVRYTHDDKRRTGHVVRLTALSEPLEIPLNTYANDAHLIGRNASWRAGFDADLAGGLVYGSVATGYKQGGFGDGCSTGHTTLVTSTGERCDAGLGDPQTTYYKPETLTAYELGYRGQIASGVRFDAAAFYYDYRNMQLSSVVIVNGAPSLATTNAGKAHILGLEMEALLQPARNHQLTIGLDLTDAHYVHFCPGGTRTGGPLGACLPGTEDFAGRKLDRTPAQVIYARYSWTIPLAHGNALVGTLGTRLKARYAITEFTVSPVQYFIPAHTTTSADVAFYAASRGTCFSLFVKNLEGFIDLQYVTSGSVTPSDPRTFGGRVGFTF